MSRTDKDQPDWVKALRAEATGKQTRVRHSVRCVDYVDPYTGAGPRAYVVERRERAVVEANGWVVAHVLPASDGDVVYARVPADPLPCTVDTATGKCCRYVRNEGRRYECSCCRAPRKPRRRAAERDWAREVVKEYRGTGGLVHDADWLPEAREYDESRRGWQSRYTSRVAW